MNVYSDGKEVGNPSGPSGPSGLSPLAQMQARFGNANLCEKAAVPAPVGDVSPPQTGRESAGEPPAAAPSPILAEHDAKAPRLPPGFPTDAVIVVADESGNYPSDRRFKVPHMWCWIGGPRWFYVSDFPIPLPRKGED